MGAFIVNLHVRHHDQKELIRVVSELVKDRCWVAAPKDGWASIYEERASTQDDAWIRRMGADVSCRFDTSAVAFLVHDSDFLCYWLFERGQIVDEFNSCPDYFEADGSGGRAAATLQGQPKVLLRFCKPGSQLRDVKTILEAEPVFAEEQLQQLAALLGIDEARAMTDYRDLDETAAEEIQAEFIGDSRPSTAKPAGGRSTLKFPGVGSFQDDDENSEDDDSLQPSGPSRSLTNQLAKMLGMGGAQPAPDPLVAGLIQAAADGNITELERLIAAGAA